MRSRGGRRPRAGEPSVAKGPPGYESLEEQLSAGQRLAVDLAQAINQEAGATVAKARFGLDEHRVVVTLRNLGVEMTVIESGRGPGASTVTATFNGLSPAVAEPIARLVARGK